MASDDITAALEAARSDLEAFNNQVSGKDINLVAQAAQIRAARDDGARRVVLGANVGWRQTTAAVSAILTRHHGDTSDHLMRAFTRSCERGVGSLDRDPSLPPWLGLLFYLTTRRWLAPRRPAGRRGEPVATVALSGWPQ